MRTFFTATTDQGRVVAEIYADCPHEAFAIWRTLFRLPGTTYLRRAWLAGRITLNAHPGHHPCRTCSPHGAPCATHPNECGELFACLGITVPKTVKRWVRRHGYLVSRVP